MNNNWHKKEKPLLGLTGLGGGVDGLAVVGAAAKTYIDDVFSQFLYKGNNTNNHHIQNGIDLTEGGLVWIKDREQVSNHTLTDSAYLMNTTNKDFIQANTNNAAQTGPLINSFESNGFKLSGEWYANSAYNYSSSTFRKSPKFFDVVTWTGTSGYRTLNHSLECIPGFIMLKRTDTSENWICWQRSFASANYIKLNASHAMGTDGGGGSNPNASVNSVSSTQFTVGADNNGSGGNWVAYLFAGGAATQQYSVKTTAGASNYMSVPTHSDLDLDGDFTVEFWHKRTTTGTTHLFSYGNGATTAGIEWYYNASNVQKLYVNATEYEFPSGTQAPADKWVHYAISREGTNTRVFVDGVLRTTYTSHSATITGDIITGNQWGGSISASDGAYWSNLRVVKGTAVYTAAFTPPQSALTNITNTKLLCWNSQTTTGATVSPVTIVQNGTVTSKTDTPSYSDPECFKFGPDSDKNIVATGMYTGNGSSSNDGGVEIDLGWEPQWLLIKNTDLNTENWFILDTKRGIPKDHADAAISTNTDQVEASVTLANVTPTGFMLETSDDKVNGSGHDYMYMAIRRPDGYVGKPPSAGTDVFAMGVGNGGASFPNFVSNFPVDFSFFRDPTTTDSWYTTSRILGPENVYLDGTAGDAYWANIQYDSEVGIMNTNTLTSSYQAWMFKRGQGFDSLIYTGNGSNVDGATSINHNLAQTPEMIWIKTLNSGTYSGVTHWTMSHKDLNGGTNPWQYTMSINNTWAEAATSNFGNTAPTSTKFYVGDPGNGRSNDNGARYLAMLFASANDENGNPISKVGYYTGNASTSGPTITTGFQPRFILLKNAEVGGTSWYMYDTLRGLTAGNDARISIDNGNQTTGVDDIDPSATGFQIVSNWDQLNGNNERFIYYAHA